MLVKMIWIVAFMFLIQSVATAIEQNPTLALEKTVLQEIDNLCGDSWCEGQYDYKFDSFKCFKDSKCILNFKMLEITDAYGMIEIYQNCFIKSKDVTSSLDKDNALKTDVYDQINTCISKKEMEI